MALNSYYYSVFPKNPNVTYYTLDVDIEEEMLDVLNIEVYPTYIFLHKGKPSGRMCYYQEPPTLAGFVDIHYRKASEWETPERGLKQVVWDAIDNFVASCAMEDKITPDILSMGKDLKEYLNGTVV